MLFFNRGKKAPAAIKLELGSLQVARVTPWSSLICVAAAVCFTAEGITPHFPSLHTTYRDVSPFHRVHRRSTAHRPKSRRGEIKKLKPSLLGHVPTRCLSSFHFLRGAMTKELKVCLCHQPYARNQMAASPACENTGRLNARWPLPIETIRSLNHCRRSHCKRRRCCVHPPCPPCPVALQAPSSIPRRMSRASTLYFHAINTSPERPIQKSGHVCLIQILHATKYPGRQ